MCRLIRAHASIRRGPRPGSGGPDRYRGAVTGGHPIDETLGVPAPEAEPVPAADAPPPLAVAIVVAAGAGVRMGAEVPKALMPLAGRPMVAWSVDALRGERPRRRDRGRRSARPRGGGRGGRGRDRGSGAGHRGRRRAAPSRCRAGLDAAPAERRAGAGARRRAPAADAPSWSTRVLDALDGAEGAIAAAPVADTLKRAGEDLLIGGTVDRAGLWAAQTPQAFWTRSLRAARSTPPRRRACWRGRPTARRWSRQAGGTVRLVRLAGAQPEGHDAGRLAWRWPPEACARVPADLRAPDADRLPHAPAARRRVGARRRRPRAGTPTAATCSTGWIGRYVARARVAGGVRDRDHRARLPLRPGPRLARRPVVGRGVDRGRRRLLRGRRGRAGGGPARAAGRRDGLAPRPAARDRRLPRRPPLRHRAGLGPLARPAGRSTTRASRPGTAGRPSDVWARLPRRARGRRGVGPVRRAGPPGPAQGLRRAACRRRCEDVARRGGRGHRGDAAWPIECSSAGLRKPVGELYPEPRLLARFRARRRAGHALERRPRPARTSPATTPRPWPPCAAPATRPSPASRLAGPPAGARCGGHEGRLRPGRPPLRRRGAR